MNKETKRSITYTTLTIILVMISLYNGTEETSLISYTTGLLSVVSGMAAFINIIDAFKSKKS